jgi:hypothetical protein
MDPDSPKVFASKLAAWYAAHSPAHHFNPAQFTPDPGVPGVNNNNNANGGQQLDPAKSKLFQELQHNIDSKLAQQEHKPNPPKRRNTI